MRSSTVSMLKDKEKAAIVKVASLGVRHKIRADALRMALSKALAVAGLPMDSMDEYVAKMEAELFQKELERVENLDSTIAAHLDDRSDDELGQIG